MLPLGIQWLFENGHDVWGYIASVALFIGYLMMSYAVHVATDNL